MPRPHLPARRGARRPGGGLLRASRQQGDERHNAAERIAAEVIKRLGLPIPVWIEQRMSETAHGSEERFALVVFSDYEVRELAPPYLGVRLTIGEPTFKRLDRASVEVLVDQEV